MKKIDVALENSQISIPYYDPKMSNVVLFFKSVTSILQGYVFRR